MKQFKTQHLRSVWFTNQLTTVLMHGDETGNSYAVFETVDQPGGGPRPLHTHAPQETFCILEGTIRFFTVRDGKEVSFLGGPSDVVQIPAGEPHGYRNDGPAPSRVLAVVSPGGIMEKMFLEGGKPVTDPAKIPSPPNESVIADLLPVFQKYGVLPYRLPDTK